MDAPFSYMPIFSVMIFLYREKLVVAHRGLRTCLYKEESAAF